VYGRVSVWRHREVAGRAQGLPLLRALLRVVPTEPLT